MKSTKKSSKALSAQPTWRKALYPGSFDPITNGHLDVLDRALKLFDEIVLVVVGTTQKSALFTFEERVELIRESVRGRKNVSKNISVEYWPGLLMDFAKKQKATAVVRGLRAMNDFEYEYMMASMNRKLNPEVETVFITSSQDFYFISSSMIKEVFRYGGDISPYVPKAVVKGMVAKK